MSYLSGTLNKRTRMYKEVDRYRKDAEIDYELRIINIEEYNIEIKSVHLLEKALFKFCYLLKILRRKI